MNKHYELFLRLKYVFVGLVVALGFAITPWMKQLAYAERGYEAVGGEYAPLVISFIIAVAIIQGMCRMQADYRAKIRKQKSKAGDEHGELHEVREEAEGSELYHVRLWEGVRYADEHEYHTVVVLPKNAKTEKRNRATWNQCN